MNNLREEWFGNVKGNLLGMSPECISLIDRMAIHNKPGGLDIIVNH